MEILLRFNRYGATGYEKVLYGIFIGVDKLNRVLRKEDESNRFILWLENNVKSARKLFL